MSQKDENYQNCLEANQLENKINHPEKHEIDVYSLKKDHKKSIKNKKMILKKQQRFKSERHNVFTEEIDNIALSSNHHKRMRSIDSTETYPYGRIQDLVAEKEETKYNIIIKQCKND